jgi:hypothetical protein
MEYEPTEMVTKNSCPVLKALNRRYEIYLTNENRSGELYRIINNQDFQLYMLKIDYIPLSTLSTKNSI